MNSLSYSYTTSSSSSPLKREDALQQFETGRIKHLQEERLHIQKKTFTKWMNSFLNKAHLEVLDLFTDLADGKILLKLLEIISGEKLGKPNNGKMRVHKVENVNKSLAFLHTKVRLESIGAEDIVDGNPRLILGLIWTIILRFHIQEIEINLDEENESSEKKSAKDALLLWCQRKTAGYRGVNILDFTTSWRNGMGFNALIHAHRPDLVDYHSLDTKSHIDNLNNAFRIAHEDLAIARILDAEDVDTNKPDEKSIITYVASYYHTFARMRDELKGSRRIANIMTQMKDIDDSKARYEGITTSLLEWIRMKIIELDDHTFPNSLDGIQKLLIEFKTYRTEEKPPKYMECSEIEALFFSINASLKALNQPTYMPKDGQLVKDIEREWQKLEKSEHRREVALREELLRQEKLEHLAFKFEKKSVLRKGYLEEMIQVLSDPRYGSNLSQVDATVKKHEAISADILARKERFEDLTKMADDLDSENYHGKERIRTKERDILEKWKSLLELLEKHKLNLQQASSLMAMLREADTILGSIKEMAVNFRSEDVGGVLMGVEDLIQKHALMESQVNSMGETIKRLNKQGNAFITGASKHKDTPLLKNKLAELNQEHQSLLELASRRRDKLEEARNFYSFQVDVEEEEAWVVEKQRICQAEFFAKDLRSVMALQQKHKTLEDEMRARRPKADSVIRSGNDLCKKGHPRSPAIQEDVDRLIDKWKTLEKLSSERRKQLEDAAEAYSFMADANETESWIKEKIPLVQSSDFGEDEPSAQALLQLNTRLQGEIQVYDGDIKALNDLGGKLVKSGITHLNLTTQQHNPPQEPLEDEWEYVEELVPQEYFEEVVKEKIDTEYVTEEKMAEMVKARYPFEGQGMTMAKGEEMYLVNKTNNDWWNVRKASGEDGFVPANYVREIESKPVKVRIKKSKKTPIIEKVKKTRMLKQKVKKKKPKAPPRRKIVEDSETVDKRLTSINGAYKELKDLAELRTKLLHDSIKLFAFYRECFGFDQWMRDQEKLLKIEEPSEGVEAAKRKFEQFLTDLSAASRRVDIIDKMADDLAATNHSQIDKVRGRQKQIHDQWNHLNRLKQQKERSLEGASSVELFHRTCDEARDWMVEKMEKLDTDELGRDLKTIQSLQRKHDQLERELAPVEDKVNRVKVLGNSVKASYPHERKTVEERLGETLGLWQKLKGKANDRRNRLEEAVGNEIFLNSSKNLLNWVGEVKQALNADEPARDVSTAEKLLENHNELGDDIRAHEDEFKEISELGNSLVKRNPDLKDVKERLGQLSEEEEAINRGWQEKGDWLRQCLDLQLFNREADHIDASTGSHEAFLDFANLGSTLDEVEALLKRHDDFENTLIAQDERLKTFSEMATKLIEAKHYDAKAIDARRNQVIARRNAVKDRAQERRATLDASMAYQQFSADAEDFDKWMTVKKKTADDESYKDLSNLERKLQKHEAFERELRANEGHLRRLNKTGEGLIGMKHYRTNDIRSTLDDLNDKWQDLASRTQERGKKLKQAYDQLNYNKNLEETVKNLESLEAALQNKDLGSDLRSCKELLNKQTVLETEINNVEKKISDMYENGHQMAQAGHFDSENILKSCQNFKNRFDKLKGPIAARRAALEESLRFYEFKFQVEAELQWINDHIPAATSQILGQSLHEAQNLQKKHRKLEAELMGHKPQIERTLSKGENLIEEKHPEKSQIEVLCQELEKEWEVLNTAADERKAKLELNLKAQYYFFEANEVESWMNEKRNLLETKDYGKDEDVARKMLTKHKALELEIDTYSGLVKEMGVTADNMIKANHPESKLLKDRQQVITQELKNLHKLSVHLRQKLMESMYRHEYFREAEELEKWIAEQMLTASSEDYGQDYEHLLVLQAKFDDFKHRVEAGSERFNQCDELAKKLIASESPYASEMDRKREQLSEAWNNLLEIIHERDEKLEAAGEIHRFNRDVAEALSRIQEKYKGIPDDLGRDVNSVQSLIRKHEGFENDLVALEAQLQVLVDDAAKLQEKYPGSNTEHIAEQQAMVVENWNTLQEKAINRRKELQEAEQLQKFIADARSLMGWSTDLRSSMKTHEKVRDAASAQALKGEHERIKAEIEAREDVFQKVVDQGQAMVDDKHYAYREVEDRVNKVLEERSQLHAAWQNKKVYLDQLIDLQFFLRDVKQLDSLCIAQEASLSSSECGQTIEEVDAMVKKHLAFEKLFDAQEDKMEMLRLHGAKLIEQNHFYSPNIKSHIDDVSGRRGKVKNAAKSRKQELEDGLLYARFIRDVSDANVWIDEKASVLEAEKQKGEVTSFEDKVKKLQRHQAFMAEIQAHQSRIEEIVDNGNLLVSKRHPSSPHIKEQIQALNKSWTALMEGTQTHFRGLEEAQDILEFNTQVEKVEAWIRDKEMLVQAGDLGKDYEHCLSIKRKLEDVDSDMRVDDDRFVKLNHLADKIISQGRGDNKVVQNRREDLNQKWKALKGFIDKYHSDLAGALEVHGFNRDVDDTRERISEKAVMLATEDTGRDLVQVEGLQRKQEGISRDMSVIEKKINEHSTSANELSKKYPPKQQDIMRTLSQVQQEWDRLCEASANRQKILGSSYTLHKFNADLRELQKWEEDIIARMNAAPLPTSTHEADVLLQEHQERKAEIDGRKEVFKHLASFGEKLLKKETSSKDVIEQNLEKLSDINKKVNKSWEDRHSQLSQAHQLQIFLEMVDQSESWLSSKEAFLANDDLGDSTAAVDSLIRKHESFLKASQAQANRIDDLEKKASELVKDNHYDAKGIDERLQSVLKKRDNLSQAAQVRSAKLAESKSLQQFLRNVYEVEGWITEKLQVACDESYRDPTNLQSKIQKHGAFEAELTANSGRVGAVTQEGEKLLSNGHYAKNDIQISIEGLESLWNQLQDSSQLKKNRLNEAYQALLFNRTLDDLEFWMDDVELQLQSEDHGKDLTSVQNLIAKHQRLEADITNHQTDMDQAQELAQNLVKEEHFMSQEIVERVHAVIKRYDSLHEPVQIRKENLQDSLLLQQLLRDLDDELLWLTEKEPLVTSDNLGSSLIQVQSLQKKHQTLEAEIQLHEPVINSVNGRAQQMLRSGHFASSLIEEKVKELLAKLALVKDSASVRRLRLLDAVESQMFYSEANEAEAWMREKRPLLASHDYGKDEDSVVALIKKLEILGRDIINFKTTIDKLSTLSEKLSERGHFDADNVNKKMAEVSAQYDELKDLKEKRGKRLLESQRLYQFLQDSDAVLEWMNEQMAVAASEDYGHDVEHVEVLIQKFDSFMASLTANSDKTARVKANGLKLIDEDHPEPECINEKVTEVLQSWEDLRELATARQEALMGAKQVHVFDRNADETKTWIAEKGAIISSEDYGHDLETIQGLARKHQVFERDLAAVKEQVESVVAEAKRLAELFPDAREHISVKHEETVEAWNELLEKSALRKDKLYQAEQLQSYFDDYRELMAWINEIIAKITSPELPKDVSGSEALLTRHKEYKTEIDSRMDAFEKFKASGNSLVDEGHFMSEEIIEKISTLEGRRKTLLEHWQNRMDIYQHNLDLRIFLRDAHLIETWIDSRESIVRDDHLGESIAEVEELLRRHDDFLVAIDAQEDKLDPVKRLTMIEEKYKAQKKLEEDARKAEATRKEQERKEEMMRKEVQRINDKRREDGKRRTQEIKLTKDDAESIRLTVNGEYVKAGQGRDEEDSRGGVDDEGGSMSPLRQSGSHTSLNSLKIGGKRDLFRQALHPTKAGDVKRAESMKIDLKKPKRTPSFTTRRRTQSFRKHKRIENLDNLPPVEVQEYLERKQELQTGGKKATIRSWKLYYTVLCGQLLCFFKDEDDFYEQKAASSPVSIFQAKIEKADDYTKRKNVFRIITRDGAEYLFLANSETILAEWVSKLTFHAQLPPSMQLLSYDNHKDSEHMTEAPSNTVHPRDSDNSSSHSTPEIRHRSFISAHPQGAKGGLDPTRPPSQALDNPLYANLGQVQEKPKPPVPPRSNVTNSKSSQPANEEMPIYQNRVSVVPSFEEPKKEIIYQNFPNANGHRRLSADNVNGEEIPPLPSSAPPGMGGARHPLMHYPRDGRYAHQARPNHHASPTRGGMPGALLVGHQQQQQQHPVRYSVSHQQSQQQQQYHHHLSGHQYNQVSRISQHYYVTGPGRNDAVDGIPGSRQPYSEYSSRTMSLPQGTAPPQVTYRHSSSSMDTPPGVVTQSRHSASAVLDKNESSSENDSPHAAAANGKESKKKSVLKFFRRKGAQV